MKSNKLQKKIPSSFFWRTHIDFLFSSRSNVHDYDGADEKTIEKIYNIHYAMLD